MINIAFARRGGVASATAQMPCTLQAAQPAFASSGAPAPFLPASSSAPSQSLANGVASAGGSWILLNIGATELLRAVSALGACLCFGLYCLGLVASIAEGAVRTAWPSLPPRKSLARGASSEGGGPSPPHSSPPTSWRCELPFAAHDRRRGTPQPSIAGDQHRGACSDQRMFMSQTLVAAPARRRGEMVEMG